MLAEPAGKVVAAILVKRPVASFSRFQGSGGG
jgi:hypothetical protein